MPGASKGAAPRRCSARLSAGGGAGAGGGDVGGADEADVAREAVLRRAAAAAEAARRRARAAERAREVEDSPRVLRDKCRRLARAIRHAKHLVVYTGAGISTAADIPDYRGPRGVWTRLRRGEPVRRADPARANPTYTHMALTALWRAGKLKFVASQNCDGLHVRAGLPRRALAELHGDMFAERCAPCGRVYLRAGDTTRRTARHAHRTARLCHACAAPLRDSIVHFGERGRARWPLNWAGALRHARRADVVLCLGSSLKVLRRYPRLWRMQRAPRDRPRLYIVNLQWTPKDKAAALKINARCDAVMREVARRLRVRVPRYSRRADPLLAHAEPLAQPEAHTAAGAPCLLAAAAAAGPSPPGSSRSSSACSSLSSPSTSDSDSDAEVPLGRLAARLRAPDTPPARPIPPQPPPGLLHAFQVTLRSGPATVLLRAEHAPSARARTAPGRGAALSDLRRFRMARAARPPLPPPPPPPLTNGHAARHHNHARVKMEQDDLKMEQDVKEEESDMKIEGSGIKLKDEWPKLERLRVDPSGQGGKDEGWSLGARLRRLLGGGGAGAGGGGCGGGERAAGELAAAIIARAVLLCRASLYPGLHTIIAPADPAPVAPVSPAAPVPPVSPASECAWCRSRHGAARCLWYGPPARTPLERRAWRVVRARRYLCACCGPGAPCAPLPDPEAEAAAAGGGGEVCGAGAGWYGKGYRKGRPRRR